MLGRGDTRRLRQGCSPSHRHDRSHSRRMRMLIGGAWDPCLDLGGATTRDRARGPG